MSKPPLWTPKGASDWLAHASTWQQAAVAGGAVVVVGLSLWWSGRVVKRRTKAAAERLRAAMAGDETTEPMDPYIAFVTLMATLLSVSGMWRVFGETMHLPNLVRAVSCSVLEASGFAFMRLARKDILMKRPATQHTVIVWVIAVLSGTLSAGASQSPLEAVIRISMPLLAVKLCHSWMLPIPAEITLNQLQKGKRAWRYIKAQRRLERASNRVTKYINGKLMDLESDRLAKRALMIGDASSVLAASERASIGEALRALGVRPTEQDAAEDESGAGSATAGLPESEGPEVRESEGPGVRESESERVRESVTAGGSGSVGPQTDPFAAESGLGSGPESVGPRVRESVGPQGPDSAGPWVRGSESDALGEDAGWPWEPAAAGGSAVAGVNGSVAAGRIPAMRHTPEETAPVAAQPVNGRQAEPWPPHWDPNALSPSERAAAESAAAGLAESESLWVRESGSPQGPDSAGPRVRGSESAAGFGAGPDSVADGSGSVHGLGSVSPEVRESVGPDSAGPWVRESESGIGSESVESDPRWTDETGRLARLIVAENGGSMTRRAFLEELRERGGRIASEHRSALYGFAMSPVVPTEADLADDTADYPNGIPGLDALLQEDGRLVTASESEV